ncbi:hypothetical protein [Nocardioides pakistanensis]
MKIYTESDFVKVVDAAGNEQPPVPKAWVGKDLLPEGTKRAGRSSGTSSTNSTQQQTQTPAPSGDGQPAGNASRDDWAAYAVSKGATDADLVDDKGEPLGRDEIKAKYGTQPS